MPSPPVRSASPASNSRTGCSLRFAATLRHQLPPARSSTQPARHPATGVPEPRQLLAHGRRARQAHHQCRRQARIQGFTARHSSPSTNWRMTSGTPASRPGTSSMPASSGSAIDVAVPTAKARTCTQAAGLSGSLMSDLLLGVRHGNCVVLVSAVLAAGCMPAATASALCKANGQHAAACHTLC